MAALIVLLLFAAGLFVANRIAVRHDVRRPRRLTRGKADATVRSADLSTAAQWSMAWTAVDDRQFRRLVDGTPPDGGTS